jgi:hypothetical protein
MAPGCRVSFVVTSRNDDHGGEMLRRFGIFADGLLEQANRHGVLGELIIVEWNPPAGPRLYEVLKLRAESDTFPIRIIEVPAEAHLTIRNADTIPLFQMIAKNVGIRRARGEFVVATNPDLLFSDALMSFLATGELRPDAMYRLDRRDVPADVPEHVGVAEQLAWCAQHVLRNHGRRATTEATASGALHRLLGTCRRQAAALRRWSTAALLAPDPDLSVTKHSERRTLYRRFRRAKAQAYALYGPRRVLRHAVWLGLKRLLAAPDVHINGCGDFTMLSRDRWFELQGYPELPLWSMHLDAFLCFIAVGSGLREQVLRPPCAMFHMEHGRSWVVMAPEERLRTFASKPWIDTWLLSDLWEEVYKTRRPIVCNGERWGLGGWSFTEVRILSGRRERVILDTSFVPA